MASLSSDKIAKQIASIVGDDHIRAPRGREARAAGVIAEPANAGEIAEIVRACETGGITIAPMGAARTLAEIRLAPAGLGVSLSQLARVVAYEPADMTVTVEAGLSAGSLNRSMESARQRLPVDPRDPDATTVGAMIAASHAGPLRRSEGTVRDLLIGIRFSGHGGRMIHSGGRVVKNVAGYDLMKVLTGSFGTLGIITEATFKVRPVPEQYELAVINHDRADDAFSAARGLDDALTLAHLEVLSPAAATACGFSEKFVVLAGMSGSPTEVNFQCEAIVKVAANTVVLDGDEAIGAYQRLRDFDFTPYPIAARVVVAPAGLAQVLTGADVEFVAHAASGIAQIFLADAPPDARIAVERWREAGRRARGHVRVLHLDPSLRGSIDFFDAPNSGALGLMRRMKAAFDPAGVFNPGCFVGGI
ncbi:MAG: FAD-binding oxidoreductase [Candidatus Binataceae bacterium]